MSIAEVRIVLKGDAKDQAPSVVIKYQNERGEEMVKDASEADLSKTIFSEGAEGEFWFDLFSGIEADEGIGGE